MLNSFRAVLAQAMLVLVLFSPQSPLGAQEHSTASASNTHRAGLASTEDEDIEVLVPEPRIHNPKLFEKSLKAAVAATQQYGTTDSRPDQERRTGRNAETATEPEETDIERVQRIGYQLALVSGFDKYPFTFGVVALAVPNAFALPAGQIFITQGMLDLGLTDDQLSALLGHEIVHVTAEHFLQMRRRAALLNSLATLVTVGAVAAASQSNDDYYQGPGGYLVRDNSSGDMLQAAVATGAVLSELLLRNYSRDHEDEADEEGQKLAALAGFDTDGARQLMAKMNLRIPQDKSFGYWQTHPFFDERVLAAEARGSTLVSQPAPNADHLDQYRQATQKVLLDYVDRQGVASAPPPGIHPAEPSRSPSPQSQRGTNPAPSPRAKKGALDPRTVDLIQTAALRAWPKGSRADSIRIERLHSLRARENTKLGQSRDYGRLISAYLRTTQEIRHYTPESPALDTLSQELGALREQRNRLLPISQKILDGGIYQTEFLESYLSNFPDSDRAPEAALQLGLAYSRLQREGDAVSRFLEVWLGDPDSELGQSAALGLKNLASLLTRLAALEQLAVQDRDASLAELAVTRLDQQARSFTELPNGSAYLRDFPDGLYAETVAARLENLADNLYREMRLYEQVGDSGKAIARANQILEHAPLSRAAQRLSRELAEEEIEDSHSKGMP